jgi:hypothetical protein
MRSRDAVRDKLPIVKRDSHDELKSRVWNSRVYSKAPPVVYCPLRRLPWNYSGWSVGEGEISDEAKAMHVMGQLQWRP